MSNKNQPSDSQIKLLTAGLVLLGFAAIGGLILNAVNPNFHLISREPVKTQNTAETGLSEQITKPRISEEIDDSAKETIENIGDEIEKIVKTASESADQATESGTNN